jgi:hypothetical protein
MSRETILEFAAGTRTVDGVSRPIIHRAERVESGTHTYWVVSAFEVNGVPEWCREYRSRSEAVTYWRGLCGETRALAAEVES